MGSRRIIKLYSENFYSLRFFRRDFFCRIIKLQIGISQRYHAARIEIFGASIGIKTITLAIDQGIIGEITTAEFSICIAKISARGSTFLQSWCVNIIANVWLQEIMLVIIAATKTLANDENFLPRLIIKFCRQFKKPVA